MSLRILDSYTVLSETEIDGLAYYWPIFFWNLGQINVTTSLRSFEDMNKYWIWHREIKQDVKSYWYLWANNCMLDLGMIDWVDYVYLENSLRFYFWACDSRPSPPQVKLIKGFNILRWIRLVGWLSLAYQCFHSRDYYDFLQLQRKKTNSPKPTKIKYSCMLLDVAWWYFKKVHNQPVVIGKITFDWIR